MNQEERRKRIAEAAYYRSERRGFAGDQQLDDWLAAERELAVVSSAEPDPQADDQALPPQPDQSSGNPVPAPLAKEERIRAEEIKESARTLSEATGGGKASQSTRNTPSAGKKTRKRTSPVGGSELRRSV